MAGYVNGIKHDANGFHVRKLVRGRICKATFSEEADAIRYRSQLERVKAGLADEDGAYSITLAQAMDAYGERLELLSRRKSTRGFYATKYAAILNVIPGETPLGDIRQRDIDALVRRRRADGLGDGTILQDLRALQALYHKIVSAEDGAKARQAWTVPEIAYRPLSRWTYTPEEIARLWPAIRSEQARLAFALCLLAGMRGGEALAVQGSWVRRSDSELWVEVHKTRTRNRTALVKTLADMVPVDVEGRVVKLSKSVIGRYLQRASREVGLDPPIGGHGSGRHHCASWAADLGFTRPEIALVLGNVLGGATAHYIHSQSVSIKRRVLEAVEARFLQALHGVKP